MVRPALHGQGEQPRSASGRQGASQRGGPKEPGMVRQAKPRQAVALKQTIQLAAHRLCQAGHDPKRPTGFGIRQNITPAGHAACIFRCPGLERPQGAARPGDTDPDTDIMSMTLSDDGLRGPRFYAAVATLVIAIGMASLDTSI